MAIQYKKISELDAAGAVTGAELVEVVQGGVNKKATVADIVDSLSVSVVTDGTTITGDGTAESPITASGALLDEIDGKLDAVATTDAFAGAGTAGDPLDLTGILGVPLTLTAATAALEGGTSGSPVSVDVSGKNLVILAPLSAASGYYTFTNAAEGQVFVVVNKTNGPTVQATTDVGYIDGFSATTIVHHDSVFYKA